MTGGTVRRASPAMVASYHEYLIEDYHRVRALADGSLVLVQLTGEHAGAGLSTHGARQMLERAGRRAGLGVIKPHAFRHSWASALTEATGGNTKAVADEGGWASAATVEDTYAHPGRGPRPGGGAATGLGPGPVSGALRPVGSVDDLFRLDPIERFQALITGPHFPGWLRAFARVNPETHAVAALKAILFRGGDLAAAGVHVGFLGIFAAVMLALAMVTMKRTL